MLRRATACCIYLLVITFSIMSSVTYNVPPGEDIIIAHSENRTTYFQTSLPTINMPGKPELPCYNLTFLLPYDADLSTVAVKVIGSSEEILPGIYEIGPIDPYLVNGKKVWTGVSNRESGKDIDVYNTNAYFPSGYVSNRQTGKMRAYKLIQISVTPFVYNPVIKRLKKIHNGKVVIDYQTEPVPEQTHYAIPDNMKNRVKNLTVNYQEFGISYDKLYNVRANKKAGYLIITSESIKSSLSFLQTFISGKEKHGYTVTVATESEWGGGSGDAAANTIRAWLQESYESMGVEYALFIGHPSEGPVPMKLTWPDNSDRHKAYIDYFYGDLSGDWDIEKDGKYGVWGLGSSGDNTDGGCDLYGEVHVGRIPVYGTTSETDAILQKIHNYAMADPGSISWREKVYLPLGDFEFNDGATLGNALMSKVFNPAGWPHKPLYGSACSYSSVTSAWNADKYGLMIWQGHGMPTYTQNVMSTSQSAQLDDTYPAHCYQISCHNGKPEQSDNLGYALLKNAGVSTIASAVQVLYSASMKELGTSGSTRHWAYMYAKKMIEDKLPSGAAYDAARTELPVTFSTDWLNCVEMNLYGCPAVGIYTNGGSTIIQSNEIDKNKNEKIEIKMINTKYNGKKIQFLLNNSDHQGGHVTIYNTDGSLVYTKDIGANTKRLTWDSKGTNSLNLSCGIYFAVFNITDVSGKTTRSITKFSVQ